MYLRSNFKIKEIKAGYFVARNRVERRTVRVRTDEFEDIELKEGDTVDMCIENHSTDNNKWVLDNFYGFPYE